MAKPWPFPRPFVKGVKSVLHEYVRGPISSAWANAAAQDMGVDDVSTNAGHVLPGLRKP